MQSMILNKCTILKEAIAENSFIFSQINAAAAQLSHACLTGTAAISEKE